MSTLETGVVIVGGGPEAFGADFRHCVQLAREWDAAEPLVFINAWNEWAEGNYLEPDLKWGHGYLEALRKAAERDALCFRQDVKT